jgi:hypothetical protein
MLEDSRLPRKFWGEAIRTANMIRNHCPTKACGDTVPAELWSGKKPTIVYFKAFGCTAYATIPRVNRKGKLGPRGIKSIFLGYPECKKGYRLWDIQRETVFESRDVIFDEAVVDGLEIQGDKPVDKEKTITFEDVLTWEYVSDGEDIIPHQADEQSEVIAVQESEVIAVQEPEAVAVVERPDVESSSESEEEDVSSSETETEYIGHRSLRKRTEKVKPAKYSAMARMSRNLDGKSLIAAYGPYPGYNFV